MGLIQVMSCALIVRGVRGVAKVQNEDRQVRNSAESRPSLNYVPGRADDSPSAKPRACDEHGCVDLSKYHEAAIGMGDLSPERRAIIQRIRREIASGTYESPAKVDFAARALAVKLHQSRG